MLCILREVVGQKIRPTRAKTSPYPLRPARKAFAQGECSSRAYKDCSATIGLVAKAREIPPIRFATIRLVAKVQEISPLHCEMTITIGHASWREELW